LLQPRWEPSRSISPKRNLRGRGFRG